MPVRLAWAAPDLLSALRQMEKAFRVVGGTDTVAALGVARAAIRKATEGEK